ncbi:hypothetical protein GTO91_05900 [Heliobacterium undosum]|uniref:Uncharacterized protein n=1 Tax=Heliomicrobium undosum TaxID=121734 RepID=A0A845L650_9FIRM|nr:SLC13 family permease [Heliomicrobium undosum]MZP29238.1 hypothetical protein [Heliomicrobium undosum]
MVVGVLALSAAIRKTGLVYRLALLVLSRFPPNYLAQTFAWTVAGAVLTPVIPSPDGRIAMIAPVVTALSETLRLKPCSRGSIGLAMSCLLGFGHMSFLFLNGAAVCLLILGLLPEDVRQTVSFGAWFEAALPMASVFLALSYLSIVTLYRHKEEIQLRPDIIKAQLQVLGPLTVFEKRALVAIIVSILGFLFEPWHHVHPAWVSLSSMLIVYGSSVLRDQDIRTELDWNFLLSFGAMLGMGNAISASGLTDELARYCGPYLAEFVTNTHLFFGCIILFIVLLRFLLPLPPALLVAMLSITPISSMAGVSPFVIGLVLLLSSNPWFLPFQNWMCHSLFENTEGKLFRHEQTVTLSLAYVFVCLVAVTVSIPFWRTLGLIY